MDHKVVFGETTKSHRLDMYCRHKKDTWNQCLVFGSKWNNSNDNADDNADDNNNNNSHKVW